MARRLGWERRPLSMETAMMITIGFLFVMTFTAFAPFGIRVVERQVLEQHSAETQHSLAFVQAYLDAAIDNALGVLWDEALEFERAARLVSAGEAAKVIAQDLRYRGGLFSRIELFDEDGKLIASPVREGNEAGPPHESNSVLLEEVRRRNAEIVASGAFVHDEPNEASDEGKAPREWPSLRLGVPIRGPKGEFAGVVEGTLPLATKQLSRLQLGINQKHGTFLFVLNESGEYVLHPDPKRIGQKAPLLVASDKTSAPAGIGAGGQAVMKTENGELMVVTYRPFGRFGWVLAMAAPERPLLAAIRDLTRQLFAAAAFALFFCLVTVGYISRRLLRPLKGLEQAARDLSAGQFDLELPRRGSREVQEVARALGAAAGDLSLKTAALEMESQKQAAMVRRMSVLFEVSRQVVSSLDLNVALNKVVEAATQVTPAETCSLMIYDEHAQELRIRASRGLNPESVDRAVFRKGEGLAGWVAESGEPLVVSDARGDARFVRLPGQAEDIRSYTAVPVKARNHLIGVISMSAAKPGVFDDDDVQILTLLANHAAIAIENAHLFRETRVRLNEVTALLEVSSSMASSLKLQDTLARIVSEAVRVTESAEKGTLLLLGEDGRLTFRAAYGYDERPLVGLSIGPDEGYSYEVLKAGRPLIFGNLREDPIHERFVTANPGAVESAEINSSVGVPVELGGRIIGVLCLDSTKNDAFAQPDLRLLTGLAAQAAVAIERAELFERMRALYLSGIRTLVAAVDAKDPYTRGHSDNVAFYARRMAQKLGLDDEEVERIELAGLLHDIGKIGIADTILKKPGPLSREERETMMTHADLGAGILRGNEALVSLIPLVKHHHEWHDGHGYPDGLDGSAIPLGAAIIAVADAFDTMTSDRPYRRSRGLEWAMAEIRRCRGTQFRPEAADALLAVLAEDEAAGMPYVARLRKQDAGPA